MTGEPHFAVYRISGAWFGYICLSAALGCGVLVLSTAPAPATVRYSVDIPFVAFFALLLVRLRLSATITSREQVTVRGLLRTRRWPWPEIQAIRIEPGPAGYIVRNAPRKMALLYDMRGRRASLLHMTDKNMAGLRLRLEDEVAAMRATWEQLRGPGWAPSPAAAMMAARAMYTTPSWLVGLLWAVVAELGVTVVLVVGLVTHAHGGVFQPVLLLIGPAVAFTAATAACVIRRKRHGPARR